MFIKIPPPPDELKKADAAVSRAKQMFKAQHISITQERREKLERKLRRWLETCRDNTADLRSTLRDRNNFLEGNDEKTDFPFGEDSSNIDIRFASNQFRTLRAGFIRAVFLDSQLVVAKLGPGAERKLINPLESAVNWTISEGTNMLECLKDTCLPGYRDGTALISGDWDRRIEHGVDFKIYETAEEFTIDFATAEDAGMGEEAYDEAIEHVGQPEQQIHGEYETDFVSHDGPMYTLFPLAHFLWYPLYSSKIEDLAMYGYTFKQSGDEFDIRTKYNEYIKDVAKEVRKPRGQSADPDEWDSARDLVEGISSSGDQGVSYNLARLMVKIDLDGDKISERYSVIMEMDKFKILSIRRYGLRKNVPDIIPFKFVKRDGRLLGDALLQDGIDLYRELNAIHRHRSNVRRVTDAPTLIMPNSLKEDVDLAGEDMMFRAGMTIWVPDALMRTGKMPRQLELYNLDNTNNSRDEEELVIQYLEGLVGPTQSQSGQASKIDPRAPAQKTRMLLQQANTRTEDYIDVWKESIPHLVRLHLALYFRNAQGRIEYMAVKDGESKVASISIKELSQSGVSFALKAKGAMTSIEYEMGKIAALAQSAMLFPIAIKMKPQILVSLWNDYVSASRIERPERFLIEMKGGQLGQGQEQQLLTALKGFGNVAGGGGTPGGGPVTGPAIK